MFVRDEPQSAVFPTPVGVFLSCSPLPLSKGRLPHARGGVSLSLVRSSALIMSSPRPWGCFLSAPPQVPLNQVFPTPVGVFPSPRCCPLSPMGLPHARGGVSIERKLVNDQTMSSPRPWGCFRVLIGGFMAGCVFPTPVGVFPTLPPESAVSAGLPHARGGVSWSYTSVATITPSSPRQWGCFRNRSR